MSQTVQHVYCPACGHEIPSGAGFCRACGHGLTARAAPACRACGAELPTGAEFCRACGTVQSVEDSPYVTVAASPVAPPAFDDSRVVEESPTLVDDAARVEDDAPTIEADASTAGLDEPTAGPDEPTVVDDAPTVVDDAPTVVDDARPPVVDWPRTASEAPPVDGGPSPPTGSEPPLPRRRGLLVGSLAVLVLVAGGGAYLAFGQKDGNENAAKAGARADAARVTPSPTAAEAVPTVEASEPTVTPEPTATPTATPTPTPDAGVLPEGAPSQFAGDIQTLLAGFHQSIVAHDYRAAWNLLSARKQAKELRVDGYPKWRGAQASLAPYLDPAGLRVSVRDVDRATGVALVKVTGMGWSAPNAKCSEWSGLTWAKYEDGQWRYDPGFSTTPEREREWGSRYEQLLGASC